MNDICHACQEWAYSNHEDGEGWTPAGCREDCIEEGKHEAYGGHFYIAKVKYPAAKDVVNVSADSILEHIVESCDFIPEACLDTWLVDVPKVAKQELQEAIADVIYKWMVKYKLEPNWFEVLKPERIEVDSE